MFKFSAMKSYGKMKENWEILKICPKERGIILFRAK